MSDAPDNTTCSCQQSEPTPTFRSVQQLEPYAAVFKALGQPVRVFIIQMLLSGEKCVCELQEGSGRDMSTISCHLNVLKNAGIIASEQRGKKIYYRLTCPCLAQIFECIPRALIK